VYKEAEKNPQELHSRNLVQHGNDEATRFILGVFDFLVLASLAMAGQSRAAPIQLCCLILFLH
jgi:hypothetical protein